MKKQFEDLRNMVRDCILNKDFVAAEKICKKYEKSISFDDETTEDFKWIYYMLSYCYKNLKEFEKSIFYVNQSIQLLFEYEYISSKSVNRFWIKACSLDELGFKDEAISLYGKCSYIYRELKEQKLKGFVIFNIAKSRKDTDRMEKIIYIYENTCLETVVTTLGDMEYDSKLIEMYENLLDLYICVDVRKAYELLYKIRDKKVKKGLMAKLAV